jgi:DNA-directed RNA polymerase subunit E'/Rpb7
MATQKNYKPKPDQQKPSYGVYARSMITTKVHLKMSEIGDTTKSNLERKIVQRTSGKCIPEGFVRPGTDSIKLITYSSGVIKMNMVEFQVVFECLICNPAEGHRVECVTKSITKAGIHAEVVSGDTIPMKIFIARDHNYPNQSFGNIKENETIEVQIIGKRFELNDPYIVAIAMLVDKKSRAPTKPATTAKPRITVTEEPIEADIEDEPEYIEESDEEESNANEVQAPISIPTLRASNSPEEGEIKE